VVTSLKRYSKAAAALLVGLAAAGALLPTDADPRLLAAGVLVNTLAVYLTPKNAEPPAPPTRYARGGNIPGDEAASELRPPRSMRRYPPDE